ncbi:hypothetical protein CJ030_MR2G002685 [Morella rubra]|uniref:Uncharacterized protein n=1 Tax=Morella rubra TaxID=262757 RepID=A0A6A1WE25_9ROSI|nr:hypothetical protein CJ030_MR2G002685 [Morella rubra]
MTDLRNKLLKRIPFVILGPIVNSLIPSKSSSQHATFITQNEPQSARERTGKEKMIHILPVSATKLTQHLLNYTHPHQSALRGKTILHCKPKNERMAWQISFTPYKSMPNRSLDLESQAVKSIPSRKLPTPTQFPLYPIRPRNVGSKMPVCC